MLGERELDVMSVLWQMNSGTVAEVRDQLSTPLAYTTVLTILRNLEAKGFVRHTGEGKAHRYHPVLEKAKVSRSMLARVIETVFGGSPDLLLTHLVNSHKLSDEQLRRLRDAVSQQLTRRDPQAAKRNKP
ncbi:MAG TPA: BlaI/MecI/CopY family transcriptional regulator [Gemmatimonadaceae bacterium]|jgi:predicted transcriptional regulator